MTLKDIAEMAGVSTMTVSNVINGKKSFKQFLTHYRSCYIFRGERICFRIQLF